MVRDLEAELDEVAAGWRPCIHDATVEGRALCTVSRLAIYLTPTPQPSARWRRPNAPFPSLPQQRSTTDWSLADDHARQTPEAELQLP